jgi:hypothetical protein
MTDGIYDNISIEDYHENKTHLSATTLKVARQSLRHLDWYRKGKIQQEDKPQFSFGNAFELALLAPTEYLQKVAVMPEAEWFEAVKADNPEVKTVRNTTLYKKHRDEWMDVSKGKYIINETGPESFETIEEMLSSCYQDKIIQGLIKNTEYQLSLFWTDPSTGIKLKTRPDICKRKKNIIVNLKTTLDGSPDGFTKDLKKWDYPLQACVEITGCLQSGIMDKVDSYFWLVVEKVAPFNATIYEFQESDINAVMDSFSFLLSRIKKAQDQNLYPGYTDGADNEYGILQAKLPAWYKF